MIFTIELVRHAHLRPELAVLESINMEANDPRVVIAHAQLIMNGRGETLGADSFRVRENGGDIVWETLRSR